MLPAFTRYYSNSPVLVKVNFKSFQKSRWPFPCWMGGSYLNTGPSGGGGDDDYSNEGRIKTGIQKAGRSLAANTSKGIDLLRGKLKDLPASSEEWVKTKNTVVESAKYKVKVLRAEGEDKYWNQNNLSLAKDISIALILSTLEIMRSIITVCIPRRFRYKSIKRHVVIITGTGSGIGRLLAKTLALEHGAIVICWDIDERGNKETADEIKRHGGVCHSYNVDVTSSDAVYGAARKVIGDVGRISMLINCAGHVSGRKLLDTSDEDIHKSFEINALAHFWTAKAFLPNMIGNGRGHIVTVASLAGLVGVNQLVDYCSSKYAAIGFHEALKAELYCDDDAKCIKTTLVCPSFIDTGMFEGARLKLIPTLKAQAVADDIVAGILTNQETIIIPRYAYLLLLIKNVIPGPASRRLANAAGISSSMNTFKRRPKMVELKERGKKADK